MVSIKDVRRGDKISLSALVGQPVKDALGSFDTPDGETWYFLVEQVELEDGTRITVHDEGPVLLDDIGAVPNLDPATLERLQNEWLALG